MAYILQPDDTLGFFETRQFSERWKDLDLNDDDLLELQEELISNPLSGKVIRGGGGLRKLRFAPSSWNRGKSGATRVCYVYFVDHSIILLVVIYAKNEQDNLSEAQLNAIRAYIKEQQEEFNERR